MNSMTSGLIITYISSFLELLSTMIIIGCLDEQNSNSCNGNHNEVQDKNKMQGNTISPTYKMSKEEDHVSNPTRHSIIGVVGDVRREMSGHHYAEV